MRPTGEPPTRRPGTWAAVTLALTVAAWLAAMAGGAPARETAAGLALAWAVQAVAFERLAAAMARGPAIGAWVGGMTARLGGFALLWAASASTGGGLRGVVLAYAFALVAFLMIEAGWLALATRPGRGVDEGPLE